MNRKAIQTSVGLSLLFLLVYSGTNWFTARRSGVGSFCFAFERHLPFVPLLIVPYLSIDLFFITAPFLCRNERQLLVLTRRIVLAILLAAACFLLFPLRFSFGQPAITGLLGWMFNRFHKMDLPFNQFPSLHIALLLILTPVYMSRCRGVLRALLCAWFTLIGISTVLTYQHHLIDIIGGLALAVICFHLVPDFPQKGVRSLPNYRVGSYYFAGAILLIFATVVTRPIGLLLLWPAAALLSASSGYAWRGAAIFRKHDGKLPLATYVLLWPILLGQHVSLLYYRRQCNAWDRLTDRVWIGRKLNAAEARRAIAGGVTAVLDLTGEFAESWPFLAIDYLQLSAMDLTAPSAGQLDRAIEFINAAAGVVYIHCKIGYSRTAAVAGAYLLTSGRAETVEQAVAMLRHARPSIIIRPEAMAAIESCRAGGVVIQEGAVPPKPAPAF